MKKGKQKAFIYQFTNAILVTAILFTILGLLHDAMQAESWNHMSFLAYYGAALVVFLLALFFNNASLQYIFYREMQPLTARTAYEYILHVSRGYYPVYLHCLIYLGSFSKTRELMQEWKPSKNQEMYAHYFNGLLAYSDQDKPALEASIQWFQTAVQDTDPKKGKQELADKARNRRKSNFKHQLQAKAALLDDDYQTALTELSQALENCDTNVEKVAITFDQGLAYEGLHQKEQAHACFQKVSEGNGDLYFVKQARKRI